MDCILLVYLLMYVVHTAKLNSTAAVCAGGLDFLSVLYCCTHRLQFVCRLWCVRCTVWKIMCVQHSVSINWTGFVLVYTYCESQIYKATPMTFNDVCYWATAVSVSIQLLHGPFRLTTLFVCLSWCTCLLTVVVPVFVFQLQVQVRVIRVRICAHASLYHGHIVLDGLE